MHSVGLTWKSVGEGQRPISLQGCWPTPISLLTGVLANTDIVVDRCVANTDIAAVIERDQVTEASASVSGLEANKGPTGDKEAAFSDGRDDELTVAVELFTVDEDPVSRHPDDAALAVRVGA